MYSYSKLLFILTITIQGEHKQFIIINIFSFLSHCITKKKHQQNNNNSYKKNTVCTLYILFFSFYIVKRDYPVNCISFMFIKCLLYMYVCIWSDDVWYTMVLLYCCCLCFGFYLFFFNFLFKCKQFILCILHIQYRGYGKCGKWKKKHNFYRVCFWNIGEIFYIIYIHIEYITVWYNYVCM